MSYHSGPFHEMTIDVQEKQQHALIDLSILATSMSQLSTLATEHIEKINATAIAVRNNLLQDSHASNFDRALHGLFQLFSFVNWCMYLDCRSGKLNLAITLNSRLLLIRRNHVQTFYSYRHVLAQNRLVFFIVYFVISCLKFFLLSISSQ